MAWERWIKWGYGFHKFTKHHRKHHCHLWHFASNSQRVSTHAPPADRRVLAVNARGTPPGREEEEEEEDVARGGEMAAENKPEGKREITRLLFFISQRCWRLSLDDEGQDRDARRRKSVTFSLSLCLSRNGKKAEALMGLAISETAIKITGTELGNHGLRSLRDSFHLKAHRGFSKSHASKSSRATAFVRWTETCFS